MDDYPANPPELARMDSNKTANTLHLLSHRESRFETFRNSHQKLNQLSMALSKIPHSEMSQLSIKDFQFLLNRDSMMGNLKQDDPKVQHPNSNGTSSTKSCKGNTGKAITSPKKSQKFNFDYDDEKRKMVDEQYVRMTDEQSESEMRRSKTDQPNLTVLSPPQSKRNGLKSSILTLNQPHQVDEPDREKKCCICNLI